MTKQPIDTQQTQASEMQSGTVSRGVLNVLLVFIESALTLMLRFDPKLRELVYPLATAGTVVRIRSYLPHATVYASFGYRGILLDDTLPANKAQADITINAYSFQLANILFKHDPNHIEALQIRGENLAVEQLKAFLLRMGVGGAIQNLIYKFTGNPANKPTPEQKNARMAELREKIQAQGEYIDTLKMEKARLAAQLAESQSKHKAMQIALMVMTAIALIAIILIFVL